MQKLLASVVGVVLLPVIAVGCDSLGSDSTPTQQSAPTATVEPPADVEGGGMPRRLTSSPEDCLDPAWDPRGGAIAYVKSSSGTSRPYNIASVSPDGTNDRVLATGPNRDIGVAGEIAWIAEMGRLVTNERVEFYEYMVFDSSKAPFTRTVLNGSDDAFTPILGIPGGRGGGGISVSGNGSSALWKIRTSHDPASFVVALRIEQLINLDGQPANEAGTVLLTHDATIGGPDFDRGFSLSPQAGRLLRG